MNPITPANKTSAHLNDWQATQFYPDGLANWADRGGHQHCSYCGSCHPKELLTVMRNGATIHWADRKYGWPHKAYIDGAPGFIKFYTQHLVDCSPEDRDELEKFLGLNFCFDQGRVWWQPYKPGGLSTTEVLARMQAQGQQ